MNFPYKKFVSLANPQAPQIARPLVPIHLHRGTEGTFAPIFALLDSGADQILMPGHYAPSVGLDDFKTNARIEKTMGVGMQFVDVFYHNDIEIELVGYADRIKAEVGFIDTGDIIQIPLLGRTFFRAFKSINFEEAKANVDIKPY